MAVSFAPLWKTLIDRRIKRYELTKIAGVSSNVVAKMGKNEYVSLQSVERICQSLQCEINEVVEIVETDA